MVAESEYLSAIVCVKSGIANQRDYELCPDAAKQADPLGGQWPGSAAVCDFWDVCRWATRGEKHEV